MESEGKRAASGAPERVAIIRRAALTALVGNAALSALKIAGGLATGSMAVVADGLDSSVDVLIAAMSLFVSRVIARPADAGHPWGHGRAETVATAFLAFLEFFCAFQLITSCGKTLFAALSSGVEREIPALPALIITGVSIGGKLLLALNQYIQGRKAGSAMLRANAVNMAADVVISAGVLVGLGLAVVFKVGLIDVITAMLVGFWIIKAAGAIFLEANAELMDGGSGAEQYRTVFEAVHSVAGAGNPHRTRMRRIAGFWDIDLDIEVDGALSVQEAHRIATEVERAIRSRLDGVFDIMVHVEPAGDAGNEQNEGYGLSEVTMPGGPPPEP